MYQLKDKIFYTLFLVSLWATLLDAKSIDEKKAPPPMTLLENFCPPPPHPMF